MEQIETVRDDGKDAVYTDTSQELSDAIAAWLKEQDADTQELKREERREERQATGGAIYWTTRSTAVTPSEPSPGKNWKIPAKERRQSVYITG
mgnify:CR=1 FL=1